MAQVSKYGRKVPECQSFIENVFAGAVPTMDLQWSQYCIGIGKEEKERKFEGIEATPLELHIVGWGKFVS